MNREHWATSNTRKAHAFIAGIIVSPIVAIVGLIIWRAFQ